MAYGDLPLDAPLKPNKGLEGGACNRQSCQAEPALFYNHGMDKWYCADCARDIGEDWVNRRGWVLSPSYPGHPQFEVREQLDMREAAKTDGHTKQRTETMQEQLDRARIALEEARRARRMQRMEELPGWGTFA